MDDDRDEQGGYRNDNQHGENSAGYEDMGSVPVGARGTAQGIPEKDENLNAGPGHHVAPGILGEGGPEVVEDKPIGTGATETPAGEDIGDV